ncbi:hypothetical protein BB561_003936 [Smittium simulii]|uniref:ATP synthase mitochondrial F1 complex assembly factor 2 n=1 Tax=Smittium simulii TaxID=133385 RepID=A0A2T9YIX0_9FUNG|nr:hypothetical protein BB561_003936 [Smittium simulii]
MYLITRLKYIQRFTNNVQKKALSKYYFSTYSQQAQASEDNKTAAPNLERFWKASTVESCDEGFKVKIDTRYLKTTKGTPLIFSKNQEICAALVAAEWESQKKTISAHSLPLTSIVFRSVDGMSTQDERTKITNDLIKYFKTDTILFQNDYPEKLVDLQAKCWAPIIDWANEKFQVQINVFTSLFNTVQNKNAVDKLLEYSNGFSPLKLAALVEGRISVEEAAKAARIEAISQSKYWGSFENAHEMDEALLTRDLGAISCSLIES